MNLRVRFAAWLLRSWILSCKADRHELLIFYDPNVLDAEIFESLQQQSPDSAFVTFIPVHPRSRVPLRDSLLAVHVPKES